MPSLPLTFAESLSTKDRIQSADVQGDEIGLPVAWASGLDRLKNACEHAARIDRQQRLLVTQACQQIAKHVGEAGFQAQKLPRDYEVRSIDRHWVMVKCFPPLNPDASNSSGQREVRFVASGEESLWTRFNLQVTRLTDSQVGELVADLETGLIAEIIEWVEAHTATPPISGPQPTGPTTPDGSPSPPLEPNRLRLVDLGRPKNRGVSRVEEPLRRTA